MGVRINFGSRIEDLKNKLVAGLDSLKDPFATREIVVPNGNLAKWLKIEIARAKGVTMGVEFPFLDKFLFGTMVSSIPSFAGMRIGLIGEDALTLAIGKVFAENIEENAFAPFYAYCGIKQGDEADICADLAKVDVARKFWQLARTLARYISEYDCRRTADMDAWAGELPLDDPRWKFVRLTDKKSDGTPIGKTDYGADAKPLPEGDGRLVDAQRALFRKLFAADGLYPPVRGDTAAEGAAQSYSLRQIFNRFRSETRSGGLSDRQGVRKIVLFGVSTIAPLQAEIIYQFAKMGAEIEIYYLTVCTELWDDIETNRERGWRRVREAAGWKKVAEATLKADADGSFEKLDFDSAEDDEYENPILSALGTAGRETMRLFIEMESADVPVEMELCGDGDDGKGSMLEKIQYGICHRTSGADGVRQGQDDSIQVVRAPGANREVEMVYNAILGDYLRAKEKGEWFDFSDVAVLVPDMKKYRPLFKQVFGVRGEIPYGLVDPSAGTDSFYAAGLSALLELDSDAFTRSGVLAVLSNPCVQKARRISNDDFPRWVELVDRLGVHRGFSDDAPDGSAAAGSGSFAFTWNHALKRLRLGKVVSSVPTDEHLGVPYGDIDSENCGESLSVNVEELYDAISELRGGGRRRIVDWCTVIESLADEWLAVPSERCEEVVMERSVGSQLDKMRSAFAGDKHEYPIDFVLWYVRQGFGSIPAFENGPYLTQGVTIAPLSSMRPVPFKEVYVLGLGETEFPGVQSRSRLNLKQCRACLGDATIDNVNRHFFLETLMSVRRRLVLSYDGEDTAKDEKKYPSSVIRLIEDYLVRHVLEPVRAADGTREDTKFKEVELPLLERDPAAVGAEPSAALTGLEQRIVTTYSNVQRRHARYDVERAHAGAKDDVAHCMRDHGVADGKEVEIPLKWLAEFLKEPRKAVLKRRLKIYDASKEDIRQSDDEPIDPDSYRFYAAKDRLLLGIIQGKFHDELSREAAVRAEYKLLERSAQVSGGLIGEFSFRRSLKSDVDALCANRRFNAFLEAHETLSEEHRPLRVRLPVKLDGRSFVLTGEMPIYWIAGDQLTLMTNRSVAAKGFPKNILEHILFCAAVVAGGELSRGDDQESNKLRQCEVHCFDNRKEDARNVDCTAANELLERAVDAFIREPDSVFLPIGLDAVKDAYDAASEEKRENGDWVDCAKLLDPSDSDPFVADGRVSPVGNMIESLAEECDRERLERVVKEKMAPLYLLLFKAVPDLPKEEKTEEKRTKKGKGQKKTEGK